MHLNEIKYDTEGSKCKNAFMFFIEHVTTWHGLGNLVQRNKYQRVIWLIIMICNIFFTIYLIFVVKIRYESNQIYTRVDATCKISQVPFPSVMICNANYISHKQSRNIEQILKDNGRSENEIHSFFIALKVLTHYGYRSGRVEHFTEIMSILKRHYFSVDTIMEEIHQTCHSLLLHCEYNRKNKKCSDIFNLVKTFEGFCCAFNYAALNDASEDPFSEGDEDIEYYDDRKVGAIISTTKSGRSSGLSVLFNLEIDDYPPWSRPHFHGARILISDPNDFPETTVTTRYVEPGDALDIELEPMVFLSEPSLRRVPVPQRNCWFHDEVMLDHTGRYSFETCQTECLMYIYRKYCGCLPYKYPREKNSRICELSDVACLHNIIVYDTNETCNCFLECSDKKYRVKGNVVKLDRRNIPDALKTVHNTSQIVSVKVYFDKSSCNCYKKTLVVTFDRLIGTYGGIFSLCAGGSIITMVELFYLALTKFINYFNYHLGNIIKNKI